VCTPSTKSCLANQVIRLYLQEARDHVLVYLHDHTQVVEVAVIGCCEDRHQFSASEELVAVFLDLVSAANQINVILLVEVLHDNFAERVTHTSVVFAPVDDVFLGVSRITPQEVAEQTTVRYVGGSEDLVNLLQVVQLR